MATRQKSAKAAKPVRVEVKDSAKREGKAHSKHNGTIAPAKGKLGVMIPGMGAVATTFVAGVNCYTLISGRSLPR